MDARRPKEGQYWGHRALNIKLFITAVGIRNVLATRQEQDGIYEDIYKISDLQEWYEQLSEGQSIRKRSQKNA